MGLPFYSKRTAQCSRYHFDISAYYFDIAARDMASNCAEIASKERRDRLEKQRLQPRLISTHFMSNHLGTFRSSHVKR
jgi:hypothetical protein